MHFSSCTLLMIIKYHNPTFQLIAMDLLFLVLPNYDFKLMIISNNNRPLPFYHALHLWDSVKHYYVHYTSAYTESQRLINLLKISKHVGGRIRNNDRQPWALLSLALTLLTVAAKGLAKFCKMPLITKSWTFLGEDYLCGKGRRESFHC